MVLEGYVTNRLAFTKFKTIICYGQYVVITGPFLNHSSLGTLTCPSWSQDHAGTRIFIVTYNPVKKWRRDKIFCEMRFLVSIGLCKRMIIKPDFFKKGH